MAAFAFTDDAKSFLKSGWWRCEYLQAFSFSFNTGIYGFHVMINWAGLYNVTWMGVPLSLNKTKNTCSYDKIHFVVWNAVSDSLLTCGIMRAGCNTLL